MEFFQNVNGLPPVKSPFAEETLKRGFIESQWTDLFVACFSRRIMKGLK